MADSAMENGRSFLKDSIRKKINFRRTDQNRGIPPPPVEKSFDPQAHRIDLVPHDQFKDLPGLDVMAAIGNRESRRRFQKRPLLLKELSFLLWATQGIRQRLDGGHALRMVPSAGARHALETYLCVINVESLDLGFYRYLPLEHQLLVMLRDEDAAGKIAQAALHQDWMAEAAVVFIWSAIPYRMEWRYDMAAHRVILLDAGHVCQNLYLACEAMGLATCAVAAYDQESMDRLLGLDGKDEFAIYMAPVGRRAG
ncbi:MAG: SagB/ThcOx family dehydrogenase [Dehalococcoidia bacterium]|nr:SagB/ThcOx family dehydrogenase [Dehalococcoidia bacterium]